MKVLGTACVVSLAALAIGMPAVAADKATVKFWTLKNPGMAEFAAEAIEAFKEKRPDIEVVYEDFPNEAYKTAIQVALNGSEPPDAFYNWVGEDSARLVREGLVMDVSEYGTEPDGFQSILSDGWLSTLQYDGKQYGVPLEAVSKFFYYNTNFFAEHELKVPDSFDGLLQSCRDIRAIDEDIVPMPLGNSERWKLNHFITMLNERVVGHEAANPDYALEADDATLFTNPRYVEALQKVLDLQEAGCFQDAPNATSPELTRTMFATEASPMIYCGSWCAGIFNGEGFEDFKMFRMPEVKGGDGADGTNFLIVQGYQISAKSKYPEETVAWLSHLVSPEMAVRYAETMGRVPSNPASLDSSDQLTESFKWIAKDVSEITVPINVLDVKLENTVSEAYLDGGVELLNGTLTPEQVMEKVRETALKAKAKLDK
ncbi:carbohydrate ABC transporter substrate-binding protein (CUT1 family) [Aliiruegeria haliotis]|uniref:Carbohydrate ABC transporter substrate-binding protein (CUT1 family) n=1 Tax=Aliiruegeria haliotis TaxID=1280846 RepID=A0A2T0RM18_9RHOB|nr:extracellular solute-binding protein [Aliiruegeria haliotis]PRY22170.1 carbohydrate ABC transporter substrate-binding protein (CUT1 family) [Aliiruegeria haliotis]